MDPILVTINDAARILGVSRSTIYRLINEQALKSRKVRNRTLIDVGSMRTFGREA